MHIYTPAIPADCAGEMPLEEAITRYSNALLKYCYGMLGDFHDAQDAMQESFAKAYAARGGFRANASTVTWLYKIAHNTCQSVLRKRRFSFLFTDTTQRTRTSDLTAAPANMPDPFLGGAMARAMARLAPKERALVYARAVEDIDYDQLEIIHGTRAATLRKRYERARKKLQKYLKAEGY